MMKDELQPLHRVSTAYTIEKQALNRGTFRVYSNEFARKQSPTNAKLRVPSPVTEHDYSMEFPSDSTGMRQRQPCSLTKDNSASIDSGDSRAVLNNTNMAATKMDLYPCQCWTKYWKRP